MATSVSASVSFPPSSYRDCVGIVCNGQMEVSASLEARIKSCSLKVGVDGGINNLLQIKVLPDVVVGDMDSVDPAVLKMVSQRIDSAKLERAKDVTDLEAAIAKIKAISAHALMIIFAGLGNRIDHTLGNIYLLLRDPCRTFIDSDNQIIFAINATNGRIPISHPECQTLGLCALAGTARNITITTNEGTVMHPFLKGGQQIILPFNKNCFVSVGEGELLVCLDKRRVSPLGKLPETDFRTSFLVDQPFISILQHLAHQATHFSGVRLFSDNETLLSIQPESGEVTLSTQIGQTISLIPLYGPVTGITTKGLKWELGEFTVNRLDKNFVGVSNVSMEKTFSVRVTAGVLLCVVNDHFDPDMVRAEIPSSAPKIKSKL